LYRRKTISQGILDSVFNSLLGLGDVGDSNEVNDLQVEGAINLMNKVGQMYESRFTGKNGAETKAKFDAVCARFKDIQNQENDD
jgi:hypothetical protein